MARLRNCATATFSAASLTGSYQGFIAASDEIIGFEIYNNSDVDVYISLDSGVTDSIRLPAGENVERQSSFDPNKPVAFSGKSHSVEIKQVTGTGTGNIVMNVVYEG